MYKLADPANAVFHDQLLITINHINLINPVRSNVRVLCQTVRRDPSNGTGTNFSPLQLATLAGSTGITFHK